MWKRFWQQRSRAAFILTSPKQGSTTVALEELSAAKLRLLLENHAYALHFTGPEEELLAALQRLAPEEALDLRQWRIIHGAGESPVAQLKLTGEREIRRLVRLLPASLS